MDCEEERELEVAIGARDATMQFKSKKDSNCSESTSWFALGGSCTADGQSLLL